jgi:hypothetical protein
LPRTSPVASSDNSLNVEAAISFAMHAIRVQGIDQAQQALINFGIIADVDPITSGSP